MSLSPRRAVLVALAMVAAALPACTGLEFSAVSAGATMAESGDSVLRRGKAQAFEPVQFDDCVAATRRVADQFCLTLLREKNSDGWAYFRYRDDRGLILLVTVERRTKTVSVIATDVGFFGNPGLANLFMAHVHEGLRPERAAPPS
ncbi:hypothetical protein PHYC_02814 [Phycisphaerales bacterium]|nr:hypothetical protein PHYC_02814 [Phycisphaerales bacterium]